MLKKRKDLSSSEKKYLRTLEPFVHINGTYKDMGIDTRWHSGTGKNERRVYRLFAFCHGVRVHKKAPANLRILEEKMQELVSDDFREALDYNARITTGIKGKEKIHQSSAYIFVPLSSYLKYSNDIELIDYEELKEKWRMENVGQYYKKIGIKFNIKNRRRIVS
ncbi:MAG: hypothetical protein WC947_10240 [Elusimicrobiota bacterium]